MSSPVFPLIAMWAWGLLLGYVVGYWQGKSNAYREALKRLDEITKVAGVMIEESRRAMIREKEPKQ